MNKDKVKPCPFCGCENVCMEECEVGNDSGFVVVCKNLLCQAEGPTKFTEQESLVAWNGAYRR